MVERASGKTTRVSESRGGWRPQPNHGVQATPSSVRCAPASRRSLTPNALGLSSTGVERRDAPAEATVVVSKIAFEFSLRFHKEDLRHEDAPRRSVFAPRCLASTCPAL